MTRRVKQHNVNIKNVWLLIQYTIISLFSDDDNNILYCMCHMVNLILVIQNIFIFLIVHAFHFKYFYFYMCKDGS